MTDITAPERSLSPEPKTLLGQYAKLALIYQDLGKKQGDNPLTPDDMAKLEFLTGMADHHLFDTSLTEEQLKEKVTNYNNQLTGEVPGLSPEDIKEYSELGRILALEGLSDPADLKRLQKLTDKIKGRKA